MSPRLRAATTLLLAVLLGGAGAAYAMTAAGGSAVMSAPSEAVAPAATLYYRAVSGQVIAVRERVSADTGLRCLRFAAAAGTAVCLTASTGPLNHGSAVILDSALREVRRIPLAGSANRAQVSRSGRMVSWTVFVTGESYASSGFATWTSILDTSTGEYVANIESIEITHAGHRYHAADVNYWGVTFAAGDDRFYATMGSKGRTYLVEASRGEWTGSTVRDGVECPSLSPDGTRVAFKTRTGRGTWRLSVLVFATGRVTLLAERGSVDDQAVWFDDRTIAYGARGSVWTVAADGTGAPKQLVRGASSPVLVR